MKALDLEEIAGLGVQKAAAIEVGIINPDKAPILVAENGCIAFDMGKCKPDVLRAVADLLEGKKADKKKVVEPAKKAIKKASKKK